MHCADAGDDGYRANQIGHLVARLTDAAIICLGAFGDWEGRALNRHQAKRESLPIPFLEPVGSAIQPVGSRSLRGSRRVSSNHQQTTRAAEDILTSD